MRAPGYPLPPARDSRLARARIGLLGVWGGAMLAFGGLFVPAAFAHLPTSLAAAVLGDGFAAIDRAGLALAVTCAALGWAGARGLSLRALLPLAGAAAHLASALWVTPKIQALRLAAGGSIGQADGVELAAFAQLHAVSRALFGCAAASALATCVWDVVSLRSAGGSGASPDGQSGVF